MLLLLVRHAVTEATGKKLSGWLPGFSLSARGMEQAKSLADRLEDLPIRAVYSSPLERCAETAQVISDRFGLELQTDERIGEIHYGEWQGRALKSLYKTKAWFELRARPADFRFPGGETIREAQVRALAAMDEIRKQHPKRMVVVCTHADVVRIVVAGYLGLSLDLYSRMSVAPASVSALQIESAGAQLLRLADSGTFSDLLERYEAAKKPKSRKVKK